VANKTKSVSAATHSLKMIYYLVFRCNDGMWRWFKFDDGEVTECRMDDDEELKNQCFGGDYSGEVGGQPVLSK